MLLTWFTIYIAISLILWSQNLIIWLKFIFISIFSISNLYRYLFVRVSHVWAKDMKPMSVSLIGRSCYMSTDYLLDWVYIFTDHSSDSILDHLIFSSQFNITRYFWLNHRFGAWSILPTDDLIKEAKDEAQVNKLSRFALLHVCRLFI